MWFHIWPEVMTRTKHWNTNKMRKTQRRRSCWVFHVNKNISFDCNRFTCSHILSQKHKKETALRFFHRLHIIPGKCFQNLWREFVLWSLYIKCTELNWQLVLPSSSDVLHQLHWITCMYSTVQKSWAPPFLYLLLTKPEYWILKWNCKHKVMQYIVHLHLWPHLLLNTMWSLCVIFRTHQAHLCTSAAFCSVLCHENHLICHNFNDGNYFVLFIEKLETVFA